MDATEVSAPMVYPSSSSSISSDSSEEESSSFRGNFMSQKYVVGSSLEPVGPDRDTWLPLGNLDESWIGFEEFFGSDSESDESLDSDHDALAGGTATPDSIDSYPLDDFLEVASSWNWPQSSDTESD